MLWPRAARSPLAARRAGPPVPRAQCPVAPCRPSASAAFGHSIGPRRHRRAADRARPGRSAGAAAPCRPSAISACPSFRALPRVSLLSSILLLMSRASLLLCGHSGVLLRGMAQIEGGRRASSNIRNRSAARPPGGSGVGSPGRFMVEISNRGWTTARDRPRDVEMFAHVRRRRSQRALKWITLRHGEMDAPWSGKVNLFASSAIVISYNNDRLS